jgi:hypothetical protein
MEILWPAIGISIIVVFVFFVLAQHWHRILRHHSWTIRRLTERMHELEAVGDPEFRRRLGQALPSPLEQVLNFSLRLDNRFWRDTICASGEDLAFIRAFGSFLGSVKIERWRGRSVVTVMEVLPEARLAGWQTRTMDVYFEEGKVGESFTLWDLPLARPRGASMHPPLLELHLLQDSLELCRRSEYVSANIEGSQQTEDRAVFLRVPLDPARLAEFRIHHPTWVVGEMPANGNSWQAFYSGGDSLVGYEWQLALRDLEKKSEWEQWKILESAPVRAASD